MSFEPDDVAARPPGLAVAIGLLLGTLLPGAAFAAGQVSEVLVDELPATPFRYAVDGRTYTWGLGSNQTMRGFVAAGVGFGYTDTVTRVELRRDDVADVAEGNPCGVFVQRLGDDGESLAADYPSDGSGTGECDMPELLASRIVNRGALDLFSNVLPDAKNIERADFIFDHGVLAPFVDGGRAGAGHVVGEKRGNNAVRIAAILQLDVFGQPSGYGPLVQIDSKHDCVVARPCYGETNLVHEYAFFQNEMLVPQGFPSESGRSVETVSMAFVDLQRLGLHAGQRYFGFSLFADDVDRNVHTLTDPATFPDDTSDEYVSAGDDADIYGGLAGYFVADHLNGATGRVYLDENDDGSFGEGDAGIADIGLTLYADTNGDGVFDPLVDEALSDSIDSDPRGLFHFPGLGDGGHFVVLHEGDPDLPGGLEIVQGVNPRPVFVSGADVDGVDFPFSNGDAPVGGGDGDTGGGTGGVDTGQGDGGDAGQGDAGQGDAGQGDAGQGDAGAGTAGGVDAGDGGQAGGSADGTDVGDGATGAGASDAGGGADGEGGSGLGDGDTGSGAADGDADGDAGATDGGDGGADDAGASDAGTGDEGAGDAGTGEGDTGSDDGSDAGTDAGTDDAGAGEGGTADGVGTGGDDGDENGATDGATAGTGGGADGSDADGDGGTGTDDGAGATTGGTGGPDGGGTTDADGGTGDGTDGGVIGEPDADDSSTNAVADSAFTDQGRAISIPVLDNDTDAVGDGLVIVSVSDSPDATVTIGIAPDGTQTVGYSPDFGFFGTDTFMYTIADGEGSEATGTVTVTVGRYSDIDGNGENDFVQCDCTDLTLETGVHGSGIGGLSSVALAGLAGMLLIGGAPRRRVRDANASDRTGVPEART